MEFMNKWNNEKKLTLKQREIKVFSSILKQANNYISANNFHNVKGKLKIWLN